MLLTCLISFLFLLLLIQLWILHPLPSFYSLIAALFLPFFSLLIIHSFSTFYQFWVVRYVVFYSPQLLITFTHRFNANDYEIVSCLRAADDRIDRWSMTRVGAHLLPKINKLHVSYELTVGGPQYENIEREFLIKQL